MTTHLFGACRMLGDRDFCVDCVKMIGDFPLSPCCKHPVEPLGDGSQYLICKLCNRRYVFGALGADPVRRLHQIVEDRGSQREAVNHPSHYGGDVPHEVVKCLEAWGLESDALLWNCVKYIARAGKKGAALEDLEKAAWYLARRIEALKEEKRKSK